MKLNDLAPRDLQYTPTEEKAVRLVNSEVQVHLPSDWGKGIVDRLRLDGLSAIAPGPGQYPALAVFVAERKVSPSLPQFLLNYAYLQLNTGRTS